MRRARALKLLAAQKPALQSLGVKSLAIFGSTARNEAGPRSDLDILVEFNQSPTFDQYIETRFFLEDWLGCKVDLVTLDGLKPLARVEIEKDAVYLSTSHNNSSPT
jgi:hypothetical protein